MYQGNLKSCANTCIINCGKTSSTGSWSGSLIPRWAALVDTGNVIAFVLTHKECRLWAYPGNKEWEPSVIMYWTYIICIRRTTHKPMEPRSVMSLRQKDAPQTKGKRRLEVNTQRLLNPWCDTVFMLIFNSQHLNVNGLVRNDGKSWFLSKIY